MTLEQMSSIAEIIGVVLVIASLIYVAKQLSQTTAAIVAQSRQSVLDAAQQELYHHVENAEVMVGIASSGDLTPEQHVKISQSLYASFRARQFAWLQYRDGSIDDAQWQTELNVIRFFLDSQRIRQWWTKLGRVAFGDEYSNFIDSLIDAHPPTNTLHKTIVSWTAP